MTIMVIALLSISGFLGFKTLNSNKITKFETDIQNLSCTNPEEISNYLKKQNLNYFAFKKETVENDLRKKFFCIGSIDSEIVYPDKLKLKINGRNGRFVVTSINPDIETNPQIVLDLNQLNATQSTTEAFPPKILNQILETSKEASVSAMYLVDEEGVIFEEVNSDVAFPRLSIFSIDLKIGQKIPDDNIKKTSDILEKIANFDIPVDNLIIVGQRLIIDSKPRVTFSLNRLIDRQAASLQLILRQAKMKSDPERGDMRSIESIDLRFDRPVVVYGKK